MKKNQVRNVIVHVDRDVAPSGLMEQVSRFHVAVIERRLGQLQLTSKQKAALIQEIAFKLQSAAAHRAHTS